MATLDNANITANGDQLDDGFFNDISGVVQAEAGENITAGDVVYFSMADGEVYISDADTPADRWVSGIALDTATAGNDVKVQTKGLYTTTGLTDKEQYFLGSSGALSATDSGIFIGVANGTTQLILDIANTNLISEQILGSDTTTVTFNNIDLSKDGEYELWCYIEGATSNTSVYVFFNNDTTLTNYYNQALTANSTTVSGSRTNNPAILNLQQNESSFGVVKIMQNASGFGLAQCTTNRVDGSGVQLAVRTMSTSATISNITRIDVTHQDTNGLGSGSIFRLYRVKTGRRFQ